jgi:hypothetical protein
LKIIGFTLRAAFAYASLTGRIAATRMDVRIKQFGFARDAF